MTDFDDFDFEADFSEFESMTQYVSVDICGLIEKVKAKKRFMFNIGREFNQISALVDNPPSKNECFKMISVSGGFSSIAIIKYIAEREGIEQLYVSTFRVGAKHFDVLRNLNQNQQLGDACIVTSQQQAEIDSTSGYNYFEKIEKDCKRLGWKLKSFDNHSKLILMKTKNNHYVVETSSNLNENPKMEHFNWENDEELFGWYEKLFTELLAV